MKLFKRTLLCFFILVLSLVSLSSCLNIRLDQQKFDFVKSRGFRCVGETGIESAIRISQNNEIECLSVNGKECIWGLSSDKKCLEALNADNFGKMNNLKCGIDHKKLYGESGYDNPDHWCSRGLKFFYGNFKCPSVTGLKIAIMLNKDTGDVECLTKDYTTCYDLKDIDSLCEKTNKCMEKKGKRVLLQEDAKDKGATGRLGCNGFVREQLGYPGYQSPDEEHWCKKGLAYFKYNGDWLKKSQTDMNQVIRLGKKGTIECLTKDGKDCLQVHNGDSEMESKISLMTNNGSNENPKVVKCGQGETKGKTGFERHNSWCHKAYHAILGLPEDKEDKKDEEEKKPEGKGKDKTPEGKGKEQPKPEDKPQPPKEDPKSKYDPKVDYPWRKSVFGPEKNGFNEKDNDDARKWRGKRIKEDPKEGKGKGKDYGVKSNEKRLKNPGWRGNTEKELGINKQVTVNKEKIGETWRQIPFTKKDLELEEKRRQEEEAKKAPPEPKEHWRTINDMYKPVKKDDDTKPSKPAGGYKGKWIPLMNKINFLSKQGEFIKNDDRIKINHILTHNFLHSHPLNYNTGSKQQEVTAFWDNDDNNWWIVKGEGQIKHGSVIRLTHFKTQKNLHSHNLQSPTSGQQEVSGFGNNGKGDDNDLWRLLIVSSYYEGDLNWKIGDIVNLVHVNTGKYLHSHDKKTKVSKQQEVTGFGGMDMNNHWTANEKFVKK